MIDRHFHTRADGSSYGCLGGLACPDEVDIRPDADSTGRHVVVLRFGEGLVVLPRRLALDVAERITVAANADLEPEARCQV